MKFECATEKLRNAVLLASRFTSRQVNLPILRTILIAVNGTEVVLRATNLECGVEIMLPARIEDSGVVAVPGEILNGFLSNLGSEKAVTLKKEGNTLFITAQKAKAQMKTLAPDEFPILPSVSGEKSFKMKGHDLATLIRSVAFCAATSGVKPELQSVMLYGESNKLYAIATDSFRLAEKTILPRGLSTLPQLLLPLKNAAELARLLEGVLEEIEVYYNENQLAMRSDGIYYTSRLIDGTFPDYRSIIPKSYTSEAVLLRGDLSQALKLIAVFADKFAQVGVTVSPGKKTVTFTARNVEVGENTVTLKAAVSGEEIHMTFNGRYLADSLLGITHESVKFGFSGPGKPLAIQGATDGSFLYIVMPMNR